MKDIANDGFVVGAQSESASSKSGKTVSMMERFVCSYLMSGGVVLSCAVDERC